MYEKTQQLFAITIAVIELFLTTKADKWFPAVLRKIYKIIKSVLRKGSRRVLTSSAEFAAQAWRAAQSAPTKVSHFTSAKPIYSGLLVGLIAIAAWLIWASVSINLSYKKDGTLDFTNTGQWGDSFGSLNTLFSAFALTAVVITLLLQRRANKDQTLDLQQGRFESSFFELIKLMRELRDEVSFRRSREVQAYIKQMRRNKSDNVGDRVKGHEAITVAVSEMRYWVRKGGGHQNTTRTELETIYLQRVHWPHEHAFGPYFRNIYYILNKIKQDTALTEPQKTQYSNLLRGQLTSREVTLLGLNGIARVSNDLALLLTEFRMLKYHPDDDMRKLLKRFYSEEAFMARGD